MTIADELAALSISELRERFEERGEELPRGGLKLLEDDARAGVRDLAARLQKKKDALKAEERRLDKLSKFEQELWDQGVELVGGVDEVGMAPLAGPVITAAVILPKGTRIPGVNDSKQLTPEEREELAPQIQKLAVAWAIGRAEVHEIDSINIYQAGLLALRRAVLALTPQPQHLLVDARKLQGLTMPQQAIIKGDAKSITIGAASIVAKVHRDKLMSELDAKFPGYNLTANKGYPTPDHLEALERLGACELHRKSFGPVARKLGLDPASRQQSLF
ncbi:MAG: ribonuclease HII [Deltaproteobacteria bacterium]|nr:ribonuclease HII [Deltaproteobacteria bacterium]